jgi:hypothetical protein
MAQDDPAGVTAPAGVGAPAPEGATAQGARRRDPGTVTALARRLAPGALVLILCCVLAVLCKLSAWTSPLSRVSGIPGQVDPLNAMWYLGWTPFAVSHGLSPFTTRFLGYPTGVNMMWNTWMPVVALVVWPVTALGGVVLADNVVSTLALALSAWFAYLAIRRYSPNRVIAALGGLLYGFSPYMAAQDVSHVQMVAAAVMLPVGLILLDEALVRQRLRPVHLGILIGLAGIFEFFVLEEYFATGAMAAALLVAILAASRPGEIRARWRYAATAGAIGAGLVAVVVAYPVWVQFAGPDRVCGTFHDPAVYVTDLENLVVPTSTQLVAPGWAASITGSFTGNLGEWNGFVGAGLLALAVMTVALRWRDLAVRVAGVFALVMTILSLGPYLHVGGQQESIHLPFLIVAEIPLLQDVLANRLMVFVYLALAVILAAALDRLWRTRLRLVWTPAVAVLALVPLIPAPIPAIPVSTPAYFTSSAVSEIPVGTVVLAVPCPGPYDVDGILWQMAAGMRFKLVGGYFLGSTAGGEQYLQQEATLLAGTSPPRLPDATHRALFFSELAASGVGAIVMGPVPQQARAVTVLSGMVGFAPHVTDGVAVWLLAAATGDG